MQKVGGKWEWLGMLILLLTTQAYGYNMLEMLNITSSSGEYCAQCTSEIESIQKFLGENSTLNELQFILEAACELLPREYHSECRNIVKSLIADLKSLDISWVEDYTPSEFCSVLGFCETYCCATPEYPQEIHLSFDSNSVLVMWVTQLESLKPMVKYGTTASALTSYQYGSSHTYHAGGWNGYIYLVQLTNLVPSTTYYYLVGDEQTGIWSSASYSFITPPPLNSRSKVTFAVYGDMGATNAADNNIYWLTGLARSHQITGVLHAGDISYADGYAPVFDLFQQKIEPVAANVFYMTAVGNHEAFADFTAYRNRFQMPVSNLDNNENRRNLTLYWSVNIANLHIIAISFEQDYGLAPDLWANNEQRVWLENDLKSVNRSEQNFVIVYAHRPIYCTATTGSRCTTQAAYYRDLVEDLLYTYGVDVYIGAHVHNYERTYPVYKNEIVGDWNSTNSFVNPAATIYTVAGTGGNKEGIDGGYESPAPSWSIPSSRLGEWGYTLLTVDDNTLSWEFYSADSNSLLDSFTISK